MLYQKYLTNLKVNGKSENTIRQYSFLLKNLNDWRPLEEWDKDTMNEYILKLKNEGYKQATIETRKTILKALFTWAKKPDVIEDIKIKAVKNVLRREDIFTIDDINKLIETTDSYMYKALIALLFESGARINEILKITKKDITETDQGMVIRIPATKTGNDRRTVLCIFSAQYVRNHLNYSGLTERVFPVVDVSVWEMLKKIGKKSGIDKPISAHKFRHAQATDMVIRGYNDSIVRKKLGWSPDSKVISRYQHLTDNDVINATLEKAGTERPKQPITNLKQAESLKIADASMQLSKLTEENEALKADMESMKGLLINLLEGHTGTITALDKEKRLLTLAFNPKNPEEFNAKADHTIKLHTEQVFDTSKVKPGTLREPQDLRTKKQQGKLQGESEHE